ncbi:hypothetical protein GCM10023168_25330 [Fodinibacter luteus]|uniref:Uncharacterized protein n=1 Tax=Fodinibacter luteus TaxID=552064 RepID=A0ABP8KJZ4_9MICO
MPSAPTDPLADATIAPLLHGLVDDAAVFPPGNAPLDEAVASHAGHRAAWYAGCIGPLLVPVTSVAHLVEVLDVRDAAAGPGEVSAPAVLDVVLVARPGADPALVTAGLDALRDEPRVRVVAVELAWEEGWRDLGLDDVRLALEVPRGSEQAAAVADVRAALTGGRRVVAKFRTGPTPAWPWPDEAELAAFIDHCTRLGVPFRLTGGLHHAVRGRYEVGGVPEENHGVLNVLVATAASLEGGGPDEVAGLLAVRDAEAIADLATAWPDATVARVRGAFTAYGCCTVTDPVGELADLALLPRP